MIISHKNKFVFIHISKTAGTSLEIALADYCGKNDIITLNKKNRKKTKFLGKETNHPGYVDHTSISLVLDNIPKTKNYFKFCFERHPAERVISLYYHLMRKSKTMPKMSLSNFIRRGKYKELHRDGYQLYTSNDAVIMDKIFYYEDLENSLKDISSLLNIGKLELPITRKYRKNKDSYINILKEEDKNTLRNFFTKETNLHGYTI